MLFGCFVVLRFQSCPPHTPPSSIAFPLYGLPVLYAAGVASSTSYVSTRPLFVLCYLPICKLMQNNASKCNINADLCGSVTGAQAQILDPERIEAA